MPWRILISTEIDLMERFNHVQLAPVVLTSYACIGVLKVAR